MCVCVCLRMMGCVCVGTSRTCKHMHVCFRMLGCLFEVYDASVLHHCDTHVLRHCDVSVLHHCDATSICRCDAIVLHHCDASVLRHYDVNIFHHCDATSILSLRCECIASHVHTYLASHTCMCIVMFSYARASIQGGPCKCLASLRCECLESLRCKCLASLRCNINSMTAMQVSCIIAMQRLFYDCDASVLHRMRTHT